MKSVPDLRVAVVGATGRMGKFACGLVERASGFTLVASLTSADDLGFALRAARPHVALDVTRAGLGYEHAAQMIALGIRPLVGTSGVGLDETRALDEAARARGIGGLVVPNFSLGMCLLQRAAVEAARAFEHAEIIEMHHERKKDAPSGTALDTAERMRAARGGDASTVGRASPDVPIHSVRLPGLYAHQLVVFGAAGETYTLRHDMSGPEGFGPGILLGLRYAATAVGVGRGIALAFDAAASARGTDPRS
jgi:4-hydroxy-tetrahydrodipicolinate reductase